MDLHKGYATRFRAVWLDSDAVLTQVALADIPNPALRHLKLTNTNEQKPVTSSRDTQEVPYDQGCEMLRIFHTYQAKTSLLQGGSGSAILSVSVLTDEDFYCRLHVLPAAV